MSNVEELIYRFRSGETMLSEILLTENSGLIWSVVRRYIGRGVETDDLYQLGCIGFLKAIEGFDPAYGTQFSTYAVPKIAGEIRRFIRDDGPVKVSRGIKERATLINVARSKLLQTLDREPTINEIAEATGLSAEDIAIADGAMSCVESISQQNTEDGFSLENVLSNTDSEDDLLEKMSLRHAVDKLPEKESMVIRLRYYHGLTQERISGILSVSQVQVSRIEKKALLHLKEMIN